ncbi:hypothetical protein [Sulfurimonas sp.]
MKTIKLILILLFLNFNLFAIDLANTSFVDFVRFVSNSTNKNFIIDENVDKTISIILPHKFDLHDSFSILKSILRKNNMYLVRVGSVYYIKKSDVKKFYSYKLTFLLPDKIIPILKKYYPLLNFSKSKKTIIFYSTYKQNAQISRLISLLDKPTKSKKVRISLISYKDSDIYEYGLNFNLKSSSTNYDLEYKTFLNSLISTSSFLFRINTFDLSAFISDLKTHNKIKTKFSPILSLYDNKVTRFTISQKIPYLNGQTSINGANDIKNNSYSYNDVGTMITVDNVSITDEDIYFHINMKYEIILDKTITPTTSKRSIDNYMKLHNDESIVIAGFNSDEISTLHREIPLLSSLPLVGNAFKWDSNVNKNETFAIIVSNIDNASKFAHKGGTPP